MSPDNRKRMQAGPSTSFGDVTNGSSSDNKGNNNQATRITEDVNYTSKMFQKKRKRDSSSPESNSFVSTVKTKMTNLLQASFSKWFSSPSSSKSNGSVPMVDVTDSSTDDEREPETPVVINSPPAKRKKYSGYLKVDANCLVQRSRGTSDTSVPYRNKSSRPSDEETVERSEQRHLPLKRKLPFHCDDRPAKVSPSHNSMVDLKQPSFKQSLVGSLFYPGRTSYGGAASQYVNQPNITERKDTRVTELNSSDSMNISHSSRRVMDLLEQYSSPRKDALRIPQYDRTPRRDSSSVNSSVLSLNKTQELHVPSILSLLRLKQRSRLMDGTNAARQIIASQSSTNDTNYNLAPTSTQREHQLNTSSVTPSPSARLVEDKGNTAEREIVPSFTPAKPLSRRPISNTPKNAMSSNSNNDYKFSSPVAVSSWSPVAVTTPPIYTFGSPDSDVEVNVDKRNDDLITPMKDAKVDTNKPKDWQCPDCWVFNNATKCICCGAQKPSNAGDKKAKCTVCKQSYRQAHIDKCISCEKIPITISLASTTNSFAITNPLPMNIDKSKWTCNDCLVANVANADKCVCCGAKNLQPTQKNAKADLQNEWTCSECSNKNKISIDKCTSCGGVKKAAKQSKPTVPTNNFLAPTSVVDTAIQNIVDKQKEKWQCGSCMVRNDNNKVRCVCCDTERPGDVKQIKSFGISTSSIIDSKFQNIVNKQNEKWECGSCMTRNDSNKIKCICCETEKPGAVKQNKNTFGKTTTGAVDSKVQNIVDKQNEKWECGSCMVRNDSNKVKCACCETERPGTAKQLKNTFNFGMSTTSKFKFGIGPKEQESNLKTSELEVKDVHKETNNNILPKQFTFGLPGKVSDDQTDSSTTDNKTNAAPKVAFSFGIPKKPDEKTVDKTKEEVQDVPKVDLTTSQSKPVSNTISGMFSLTSPVSTEKSSVLTATPPAIVPATLPTTLSATLPTTLPTSLPATLPITLPATLPVTLPTTLPAALPVTLPTTLPASLPANLPASLPATVSTSLPATLTPALSAAPPSAVPTSLTAIQSTAITAVKGAELLDTTPQKKKFSFTEGGTGLTNLFAKPAESTPAPLSLFPRNEQTTNSNFSFQKPVVTTTVTVPTVPTANPVFTFDGSAKPMAPLQSEPTLTFNFGNTNKSEANSFTFKFGPTTDNAGSKRFSLPSGTSAVASNPLSGNVLSAGNGLSSGNGLPDGNLAPVAEQSHNPLRTHNDLGSSNIFGNPVQKDNIWSQPSFNTSAPNLFGTNNNVNNVPKPVFAFGSTSTPFNNSTPVFGSSAQPTQSMFGMPNTSAPQQSLFSSPAQNQPAANIFGSPQPASGSEAPLGLFGSSNVSSGSTFGAPTQPTPAFEAAPIAQPPGPAFNFGGSQSIGVFGFGQPQQPQQSQQQPYNFGATAAGSPQVQFNMGSAGARRVRKAVRRNPR